MTDGGARASGLLGVGLIAADLVAMVVVRDVAAWWWLYATVGALGVAVLVVAVYGVLNTNELPPVSFDMGYPPPPPPTAKSMSLSVGGSPSMSFQEMAQCQLPDGPPRPTEVPDASPVDCTVFAPRSTLRGDICMVQVFVHSPGRADEAIELATEFDEDAARRGKTSLATEVALDTELTFELWVHGVDDASDSQTLTWNGHTDSVQFFVKLPEDAKKNTPARVLVYQSGVPIGRIGFMLRAEEQAHSDPVLVEGQASRYRYAFVSYASADRAEVLRRVQMLASLRIDFFQDLLDLEPGMRWEQQLYEHIDRADVFFLFWSDAARKSEWVRKEVAYAAARHNRVGAPDILPVVIGAPPPPPPEELAELHFGDRVANLMAL